MNTYTITYNANGGSGAPAAQSYTYATSGTINLSSTKPTRAGYTFQGWSQSSSASSASYQPGQAWNRSNASNYTLYAVWQANTYTITYNANGGSGAPSAQSYTYAPSGSINLSSTIPTRSGYTFLGWSLSSTATSPSYSAGQAWSRSNASNYTLYAVWRSLATSFTYNAGSMINGSSGTIVLEGSLSSATGSAFSQYGSGVSIKMNYNLSKLNISMPTVVTAVDGWTWYEYKILIYKNNALFQQVRYTGQYAGNSVREIFNDTLTATLTDLKAGDIIQIRVSGFGGSGNDRVAFSMTPRFYT